MPSKAPNSPKTGSGGSEVEEIISYTAERSERLLMKVKQFNKVPGEFKENIMR